MGGGSVIEEVSEISDVEKEIKQLEVSIEEQQMHSQNLSRIINRNGRDRVNQTSAAGGRYNTSTSPPIGEVVLVWAAWLGPWVACSRLLRPPQTLVVVVATAVAAVVAPARARARARARERGRGRKS